DAAEADGVRQAFGNNLKVAPRGGTHVGASTANGATVLDLRQLPGGHQRDATTDTVTPATGLYAMHQVLAAAGRGIPNRHLPDGRRRGTRAGRMAGANSRHAGLLCDQLTSASVVLPSGCAAPGTPPTTLTCSGRCAVAVEQLRMKQPR
ncbi:FAD-binding protein, partial [Mycobacterium tuberculosis]